jgi:hypothetical protein
MFESSAPARCPDSSLKSAEEMEWIHDPDDDTTILPPPPASKGTLNSFIHHSGCAVKPTKKIRETASSIPAKRSAVGPPAPAPKKALVRTKNEEYDDNDSDTYDAEEEAPPLEDVTDDEEDNENENKEAYQKTKKLGDQDREDHKSLKKVEHSANLTTIFTFKKDRINPHTQECENGWWCEVCKANNVPLHQCFFKGGISTRCMHIAQNPKCHHPIYKDHCEQWGLTMHDHAISHNCKVDMPQATLDASLTPKIPAFTKAGLMDYIVELIVAEDEVSNSHF